MGSRDREPNEVAERVNYTDSGIVIADVEIMSVDEVADALRLSPRRIRALIGMRHLPAKRLGLRTWAVARADFEAFRSQARNPGRPRGPRAGHGNPNDERAKP